MSAVEAGIIPISDFAGRTAVVTGAGSGIGRALVRALSRAGANVVLADRHGEAITAVAEEIRASGGRALPVPTDVADPAAVDALAEAAYAEFGAVHVLCNNAGTSTVGYSWQTPLSDWDLALGVNLMGVVHGIRSFVPRMIDGGDPGHVVNTASMAGLMPVPMKAPYTASKHAVVGLSQVLLAELRASGTPIGVSVVCPGAVATSILEEERARYAGAPIASAAQDVLDQLKDTVDNGIAPDTAADIILGAIRAGRFWSFPNAHDYFGLLDQQHDAMLHGS
ncbi:SDR family NAD(P)-dependent oxidoreductase [Micromonospora sp. 067-2]|uniref:SDR family NAD(P)-dependent oxidoreductase n=1 Tax=Micromonospora sp. 067-2 TaxID=2789270 RepID=UPI00397D5B4A